MICRICIYKLYQKTVLRFSQLNWQRNHPNDYRSFTSQKWRRNGRTVDGYDFLHVMHPRSGFTADFRHQICVCIVFFIWRRRVEPARNSLGIIGHYGDSNYWNWFGFLATLAVSFHDCSPTVQICTFGQQKFCTSWRNFFMFLSLPN